MTKEEFLRLLKPYVPEGSEEVLVNWIYDFKIALTITRERKTKLGDFRTFYNKSQLSISINGNLNSYGFLITLVHEIAHAMVFIAHGHNIKPHGKEWKNQYKQLMLSFFARNIFPDDIARPLAAYMKNPKASSHSDVQLFMALRKYDDNSDDNLLLSDLPLDALFTLKDRVFKKGIKRRSRYSCIEVQTNREYAISGVAKVEIIASR